MRPGSL